MPVNQVALYTLDALVVRFGSTAKNREPGRERQPYLRKPTIGQVNSIFFDVPIADAQGASNPSSRQNSVTECRQADSVLAHPSLSVHIMYRSLRLRAVLGPLAHALSHHRSTGEAALRHFGVGVMKRTEAVKGAEQRRAGRS
jgi:hypothetical protein